MREGRLLTRWVGCFTQPAISDKSFCLEQKRNWEESPTATLEKFLLIYAISERVELVRPFKLKFNIFNILRLKFSVSWSKFGAAEILPPVHREDLCVRVSTEKKKIELDPSLNARILGAGNRISVSSSANVLQAAKAAALFPSS
ncbi:hypothetical protein SLEP1_g59391 [Rubroshorea leprosula]|uniref:Uncharacterized protein n=1 Tax=Rubroshorea leprosula TaxID=152421 RepID=A0AAV5MVS2_9ROSI|nr:hypothetical protein SLEP1_g59391 [Rubroshorea leprosula]